MNQIWHDQHLKLEGPIVQTLEDQFCERWNDSAAVYDISKPGNTFGGQVIFSSPRAIKADHDIVELPPAAAVTAGGGGSPVQMWRTIPWRNGRKRPPFTRGEFTIMAGVSNAVKQSEHLIWVLDQYFWSLPLARQLNFELTTTFGLTNKPDLRVIVILPPYADGTQSTIHEVRRRALTELAAGGLADGPDQKVAVYDLWDPRPPADGRGIYCHAKVQMYDGSLLVCGSANMNRRSFTCDSELCCAVADEDVVAAHQQRLWRLLFADLPAPLGTWPAPDFRQPGSGADFFAKFRAAAAHPNAYLWPDPWADSSPKLRNGVAVPRSGPAAGLLTDDIVDPSSLDLDLMEGDVVSESADGQPHRHPPRLEEVVKRIEATEHRGNQVVMPNRRQNSLIRPGKAAMQRDLSI